MQTDAQILIFLFYASAYTMHVSIIWPNQIPEKTIIVLMILTLCLALYISYPNFTQFMLMILRIIKTCKRPIKISKGPLILGYMHVVEWNIRRCPIYVHTIIWAWLITALLRPSIHKRRAQLFLLSYAISVVRTCTCTG